MKTMRVAVVGVGRFGREHLRAYGKIPGVEVVAVTDLDSDRARVVAAAHATRVAADVPDLLRRFRPDAVSLVVPAAMRGGLLAVIAESGAAVLVEKPLASSAPQARDLALPWGERPVMVGHVLRFAEPYRRLNAELRYIGPIRVAALTRIRGAEHLVHYPGEDVIGLTMIHDLDAVGWLIGARPVTVRAAGQRAEDGRWRSAVAHVDLIDGTTCVITASWSGQSRDYAEFGAVRLTMTSDEWTLIDGAGRSMRGPGAGATYDQALVAELDHFVECARESRPSPLLRLDDARRAVALADGVRASLDRGGVDIVVS